jgi:hypothetical protein
MLRKRKERPMKPTSRGSKLLAQVLLTLRASTRDSRQIEKSSSLISRPKLVLKLMSKISNSMLLRELSQY